MYSYLNTNLLYLHVPFHLHPHFIKLLHKPVYLLSPQLYYYFYIYKRFMLHIIAEC